jgi:hypothetical protein
MASCLPGSSELETPIIRLELPCARSGTDDPDAEDGPRWTPFVPVVNVGVPENRDFSAGFTDARDLINPPVMKAATPGDGDQVSRSTRTRCRADNMAALPRCGLKSGVARVGSER